MLTHPTAANRTHDFPFTAVLTPGFYTILPDVPQTHCEFRGPQPHEEGTAGGDAKEEQNHNSAQATWWLSSAKEWDTRRLHLTAHQNDSTTYPHALPSVSMTCRHTSPPAKVCLGSALLAQVHRRKHSLHIPTIMCQLLCLNVMLEEKKMEFSCRQIDHPSLTSTKCCLTAQR